MALAIKAENLSKAYQLGQIGTGTISRDVERWLAKVRGKEDPFLRIGETNDRTSKGGSDIVWSLKDINFEIQQGDAVGIIGRNGAGKSTLLKLLSRVTAPTTGGVKVKGRIASLLEVGTGFHPELSGRENIYLNGAILGMRKKEITRKFDEIVDFAGVERYIDTPVKRYSSGMYVRLAFAVAAHLESEILIVDEVLAVGDAEFQKKCLGKMGEVSKGEGRTILFVSHNINAIRNLCSSGFVLQQGELSFTGLAADAVSIYIRNKSDTKSFWKGEYGDENVIIKKCIVYSEKNKSSSTFENSELLSYEITLNINDDINDLVVGMLLKNDQGDVILSSYYNDYVGTIVLKNGINKFFFRIPPFFLAVGSYSISLNVGLPHVSLISTNQSDIFFDIVAKSEYGNAYMVSNHPWFNSIIRPNLFEKHVIGQ